MIDLRCHKWHPPLELLLLLRPQGALKSGRTFLRARTMDLLLSDLSETRARMTDLLQKKKKTTIGFVVKRAGVHRCQQVKDSETPKSDGQTDGQTEEIEIRSWEQEESASY